MSVYTKISKHDLDKLLSRFSFGELLDFRGISDGIVNTNYYVDTETQKLVLTIFEDINQEELPFFVSLMSYLTQHGLPAVKPCSDKYGQSIQEVAGKPAIFATCLPGKTLREPDIHQVSQVGYYLGMFHNLGMDFAEKLDNTRGLDWFEGTTQRVLPRVEDSISALLSDELSEQLGFLEERRHLPHGIIHADLFRDNVLFDGEKLSGFIDFYYSCYDTLLYDVAITLNDWCSQADGMIDEPKARAFLQAYQQQRKPEKSEIEAWPMMLRAAAMRFWLSRLEDSIFPKDGEMTHIKDPTFFENILINRKSSPDFVRRLWDET